MPELPEVEATRKLCERHLKGRRIETVRLADDPIVFQGQGQGLADKLRGQRVHACERHGKYFWWTLDSGALLLHLGMTGAITVPGQPGLSLSHGIDFNQASWPPRFTKLDLQLDSGQTLAFCDARRFGRIQWQKAPRQEAPVAKLGVDPLSEALSCEQLAKTMAKRRGSIKGVLLNQRIVAGIGNWIADEVLYQAKIDPRHISSELRPEQIAALHQSIRHVIQTAVDANADSSQFPDHWLFHHRWGKKASTHPHTQERIEFLTVNGRSTAWVPSRQRG